MKGIKLYHGYSENEIFNDEEDKMKILSLREVEKEKKIAERVEELNRKKERDELLNTNKDKSNENKKIKINNDDDDSSNSEELGEIKNEHKNSNKRKKTSNSVGDEESSLSLNEDEKQVKKETRNISLEEIEKIRLSREFFRKYYNYPNFDKNVKGAFIRVNLSSVRKGTVNLYSGYEIGEIDEIIIKENHSYNFMGSECNKYAKLKISTEDNEFNFKIISNGKILEEELDKWINDKQKIPSSEDIAIVLQNITKIKEHNLTSDELNNMLTQKRKDRIKYNDSTLNVTEELYLAIEKYRYNKEKFEEEKEKEKEKPGEYKKELKDKYFKEMKEAEEDIKQLEKMKEERDKKEKMVSDNDIVAKINESIRKKQKMDEKMSLLSRKRKKEKNEREHKIFKRVDCHPTTLFDSGTNTQQKKKEEKESIKENIDKEKEKEKRRKKNNSNGFCYEQKIKQLKDYMEEKKSFIDEMMAKQNHGEKNQNIDNQKENNKNINDKKENNKNINDKKENNQNKNDKKENNQNANDIKEKNIDMSLFSKLASINFEIFNKMIKEQNKKNTIDPQVKIMGLNAYLQEYGKES